MATIYRLQVCRILLSWLKKKKRKNNILQPNRVTAKKPSVAIFFLSWWVDEEENGTSHSNSNRMLTKITEPRVYDKRMKSYSLCIINNMEMDFCFQISDQRFCCWKKCSVSRSSLFLKLQSLCSLHFLVCSYFSKESDSYFFLFCFLFLIPKVLDFQFRNVSVFITLHLINNPHLSPDLPSIVIYGNRLPSLFVDFMTAMCLWCFRLHLKFSFWLPMIIWKRAIVRVLAVD